METIGYLIEGFNTVLAFPYIFYIILGVTIGMIVGALPGVGAVSGTAILLPLTYGMDLTGSLIVLCGIYYGTMYGNTITAVMLNIPGTSASVITAIDGYEMNKQGRAGAAIGMATFSSFIGATISLIFLIFLSSIIAQWAVGFGAPEYFSLILLGLLLVSGLTGKHPVKGFLMMGIGLFIGTIGVDLITGEQRYTLDNIYLIDGIELVAVLVGLFGFSEVLNNVINKFNIGDSYSKQVNIKKMFPNIKEWKSSLPTISRSTIVGFLIGVLPGAGATIATVFSYSIEKKVSKNRDNFGKGAIEGVASAESANNSAVNGALIPMLTLGIPGSAVTAVLLGAFIMFGVRPGPQLYENQSDVIWSLFASMYVGNFVLLLLSILTIPLFLYLLVLSKNILQPLVAVLCIIGVYALNNSMFDVWVMLLFGLLGFILKRFEFPLLPLVLGFILMPIAETSLRQSLLMSGYDFMIFIERPTSLVLLIIALLYILATIISNIIKSKKSKMNMDG
ncbi:hypothetical protein CIL05_00150 [Virgibacillus profundi]|uniref:DUF112 domain-containing protein n=1 Tax=Virgibacillus profundi TaxID=2024555 RepID=A0A2A2IIG8_9BACI|nr:tripartite tricarboxylate transporter permease [Virgibacillus profundi]PAV31106.1 hypothetical protein CIL05_00150 [Virgibacillus profundi]PXY55289.1 transporter [Virgibacillus profundi]